MDLKDFFSGNFIKQKGYESFSPEKINHLWVTSNPEINSLLGEANRLIGELNAFSQIIPDVDFFIEMHIAREATKSSKIEGTKTNMEEALVKEEDVEPEKRDDWNEVQNYINAINLSIKDLEELPLSSRLIRKTHGILLSGVRGTNKSPGEFRSSQNWIGATLRDAVFVPPFHAEVNDLMNDLDKFINDDTFKIPHLIKIAIIHYQFETIHPFLDGNGRLGRLLITLYLVNYNLLIRPSLYLSDFLEKNKTYYYDNLMSVRINSNMEQWIKFFLVGVIETSKNSIQVFKDIIELRDNIERERFPKLGNKLENSHLLLRQLFKLPIIDIQTCAFIIKSSRTTASRLIDSFIELEILEEYTGFRRNRRYIFREYVELFKK